MGRIYTGEEPTHRIVVTALHPEMFDRLIGAIARLPEVENLGNLRVERVVPDEDDGPPPESERPAPRAQKGRR